MEWILTYFSNYGGIYIFLIFWNEIMVSRSSKYSLMGYDSGGQWLMSRELWGGIYEAKHYQWPEYTKPHIEALVVYSNVYSCCCNQWIRTILSVLEFTVILCFPSFLNQETYSVTVLCGMSYRMPDIKKDPSQSQKWQHLYHIPDSDPTHQTSCFFVCFSYMTESSLRGEMESHLPSSPHHPWLTEARWWPNKIGNMKAYHWGK